MQRIKIERAAQQSSELDVTPRREGLVTLQYHHWPQRCEPILGPFHLPGQCRGGVIPLVVAHPPCTGLGDKGPRSRHHVRGLTLPYMLVFESRIESIHFPGHGILNQIMVGDLSR